MLQRWVPGLGVFAAVINSLDPRGEQPVQLAEISDLVLALSGDVTGGLAGDLDEELFTNGAGRLGVRCPKRTERRWWRRDGGW